MLSLYLSQHHYEKSLFDQDWVKKVKMIRCSAPLPEGPIDPVLARMLELAPYQVPSGEDKGGGVKKPKASLTHYSSKLGELVPPRRRITRKKNLKFLLPKEGRGPPLKTWK